MRKAFIYIIMAIALAGCSESYDESLGLSPTLTPRYLSVSPTSLDFSSSNAGVSSLSITSVQTPWKIENTSNWLAFSTLNGNSDATIHVSVTENTMGDVPRTTMAYFKADVNDWAFEKALSVSQAGAIPFIELSTSSLSFTGTTSSDKIMVSSNCSWEVTSSSNWLTVEKTGNEILVSASENTGDSYRETDVIVAHNGNKNISKTIKVTQAVADITASTNSITFENTALSIDVVVNAESAWTVSTSDSWIDISPKSGEAGESSFKISVAPNTSLSERNGYVVLSVGGNQRIQIPVIQKGIYIETAQSSLSFNAAASTQELEVKSNTSWVVSSKPEWISTDVTSGEGNKTIQVTAAENPYTTNRVGTIHLSQTGLNLDIAVQVSQIGKTFDVGTTLLNFNDKAGTQTISISTDGTWSATTSDTWITISPKTASGNSTLSVTVTENTSNDERTGNIEVVMADKTANIAVVQKGKYFTVNSDQLVYTSKGGQINMSVSTNDTWTATLENSPFWLTLSKSSGNGDANIMLTACDNASVNPRSASVLFETKNHQSVRFHISQKARYLTIDTQKLLFYSKGGKSETITISTDAKYSISTKETWLSIAQSSNTFTVTVGENTTEEPRFGTISIAMTDLTEGSYQLEIEVIQLNKGGTFIKTGYGDDKNWDGHCGFNGTLVITPYGNDKNWDTTINSQTMLTLGGYNTDKNWDTSATSEVKVTITGYEGDKNWDTTNSSNTTFDVEGYTTDKNQDTSSTSEVETTVTEYDEEKNWDGNLSSNGTLTKEDYPSDKDWQ